jgi:hypothetical protein
MGVYLIDNERERETLSNIVTKWGFGVVSKHVYLFSKQL